MQPMNAWNLCGQSLIECFNADLHTGVSILRLQAEKFGNYHYSSLCRHDTEVKEDSILTGLMYLLSLKKEVSLCYVNQWSSSIESVTSPWKNSECHIYLQNEQRETHPLDKWCFVGDHSKNPMPQNPPAPQKTRRSKNPLCLIQLCRDSRLLQLAL